MGALAVSIALLVLVIIVCLALYAGSGSGSGSSETFVCDGVASTGGAAATATTAATINGIFQDLYRRDATPSEQAFWQKYIESHVDVSRDQLFDVVSYSANTVETDEQVFGTEYLVILTFNRVLDRNPSQSEMKQYSSLLSQETDTGSGVLKLTQILIGTSEYMRMERTQQNLVFGTLPGNLTDRQLTMAVTTVYSQVPGAPPLDDDTLRFLKRKLLDFNLDAPALKAFIGQFVTVTTRDQAPVDRSTMAANGQGIVDLNLASDAIEAVNNAAEHDATQDATPVPPSDGVGDGNGAPVGATQPDPPMTQQCMATLVTEHLRNGEEVGALVPQPTKYINADDNMVLYPEFKWMVPIPVTHVNPASTAASASPVALMGQSSLVGTLLQDSGDTRIGSILPFQPPT